jgi:hypothetical protein
LIARSVVKPASNYRDYERFLRWDFWFSCAYCTMTEIEATGIGFEIDHYEPRVVRPELVADYMNLLWACRVCNRHKAGFSPSERERAAGYRFFRPDLDDAYEHFELAGLRVNPMSNIGKYTIEMLHLNSHALMDIRDLRRELFESSQEILMGIRALNGISVDRLRPTVRAQFLRIRKRLGAEAAALSKGEDLLREFNRATILDRTQEDVKFPKRRREWLAELHAILPAEPNGN